MRLWRNRRWLREALAEIGCGLLTMLLFTIPLWVITVAARGPVFALGAISLFLVVVVGVAVLSRWIKRR